MPEIGRLGGTKVLMFFHDENPPHIHIRGAGFAAKLRVSNGDLIAGRAPSKVLKLARRWLSEHRSELLVLWQEFQK
jgi:hypothetical protein